VDNIRSLEQQFDETKDNDMFKGLPSQRVCFYIIESLMFY